MKAVIFDLDGVLVNTTEYSCRTNNMVLEKFGIHFSEGEFKEYQGVANKDRVNSYNKRFGKNIDANSFQEEFFDTQMKLLTKDLTSNTEILPLIKGLKERGFKLAVATLSTRKKTETILNLLGISDLFDTIITCDDIKSHKPNPEIYLETAKRLNTDPKDCIVIEDSPVGIMAGKNANMKVIALKTSIFDKEDLSDADVIINNLSEISSHLF